MHDDLKRAHFSDPAIEVNSNSRITTDAQPAEAFRRLASISFFVLIILIPIRLRFHLRSMDFSPIYGDYTDVLLFAADIAHLAVLTCWGATLIIEKRRPNLGPWFLTWPLIGILLTGVTSAFGSVAPAISWMHVVRLALLFGLYLYITNEVRSLKPLILPFGLQVGLQSVIAIAQFLQQHSIGLQWLGELELDPAWTGVSIVWSPGQVLLRSYGLTDHPNILGGSLALGMVLLFAVFLRAPRKWRLPIFAVLSLGGIALLYSFSRSGWLAFAGGAVLVLVLLVRIRRPEEAPRLARLAALMLLIAAPFVISSFPLLVSRFGLNPATDPVDNSLQSPEGRSVTERAALAESANEMFVLRPLRGVGLGAFPVALQHYQPDFEFYFQPVHMVLMDAAVETGLFGALAYLLAIFLPMAAIRLLPQDQRQAIDLVAACGVLLTVVIIGLFDYYPWFLVPGRLWHWIAWGLVAATYERTRQK